MNKGVTRDPCSVMPVRGERRNSVPPPRVFLARSAEVYEGPRVELGRVCRGVWKLLKRKEAIERIERGD